MRVKKQINIEIGEQIKYAREAAKYTQEQLAEHLDVSPQYVSDLERGVVGISISTLKRACIVLNVASDQILFGSNSDIGSVFAHKCSNLTSKQIDLLLDICDSIVRVFGASGDDAN